MIDRKLGLISLCSFFAFSNAFAQSAHTPAPGSEERTAIMEALRVPAKRDLGRSVIFKVDQLRVAGKWAFARVTPTLPDDGEIDYSRTKFKKLMDLGAFDPQGEALLFKESDGSWRVIEWAFGATDVPSAGWASKHAGMPKSLLQ